MNFANIIILIIGLYLVVCGLATLITGKVYGHGRDIAVKYTEESIRSAAPILGISTTLSGLAMIGYKIGGLITALSFLEKYEVIILVSGIVLSAIIMLFGYRKMVEKVKK